MLLRLGVVVEGRLRRLSLEMVVMEMVVMEMVVMEMVVMEMVVLEMGMGTVMEVMAMMVVTVVMDPEMTTSPKALHQPPHAHLSSPQAPLLILFLVALQASLVS